MKPKCFVPDLKLFLHEQFGRFLKGEKITLINLEVSLCGICNANCDFCFYGKNKENDLLDTYDICDFLDNAQAYGLRAATWTGGGEPTLHKDFNKITHKIASNTYLKQGLFTNALKDIDYDPSLFDWIRISKTDQAWCNDSISDIAKKCKKVGLCINFKSDDDIDSIDDALAIAEEFDSIKYVQVRPALGTQGEASGVELTSSILQYSNQPKLFITDYKFEKANNKNRGYNKCYGYHFVPFLWHNGDFGCCGYQRQIIFGNIYKDSIDNIMDNMPDFINVRKDCQLCCKNSEINESINKVLKIEDVDFV